MSQNDMSLANASGAAFRADANSALQALVSNNSGATAPATTFAYMWWADTTAGILKQRNAANSAWIDVLTLSTGRPTGAVAAGPVTASGLTQTTARILGRTTAATGAVEEISIGAGLTLAGGALSASGKALVQIQTFQTGALASGSSVWPDDNTIPQISEGDQFMSLAFTPTNAANLLEIDVVFISAASTSSEAAGCGLFRDAVADALAAMQLNTGTGYGVANATFKHVMTAGTTSLITFRVRAGRRDAGVLYFNGSSGGVQRYGGVMASRITVKEYLP